MRSKKLRTGFTLIELLFVIAIIAILASILFPTFARARERARQANCASNLMQLGTALHSYAQDYDGRFPKRDNAYTALYCQTSNTDIFYCPSDCQEHKWKIKSVTNPDIPADQAGHRRDVAAYGASSYVIKGGLTNEDRADRIIAGESQVFHVSRVNILYLGGYVKGVAVDDYKPVVPQTPAPPEPSPGPSGSPSLPPPPGAR